MCCMMQCCASNAVLRVNASLNPGCEESGIAVWNLVSHVIQQLVTFCNTSNIRSIRCLVAISSKKKGCIVTSWRSGRFPWSGSGFFSRCEFLTHLRYGQLVQFWHLFIARCFFSCYSCKNMDKLRLAWRSQLWRTCRIACRSIADPALAF